MGTSACSECSPPDTAPRVERDAVEQFAAEQQHALETWQRSQQDAQDEPLGPREEPRGEAAGARGQVAEHEIMGRRVRQELREDVRRKLAIGGEEGDELAARRGESRAIDAAHLDLWP